MKKSRMSHNWRKLMIVKFPKESLQIPNHKIKNNNNRHNNNNNNNNNNNKNKNNNRRSKCN